MSTVMDQLITGARAHRDGAMNTLDAVDRQTKAASEEIARTVVVVPPPKPADLHPGRVQRDDRFDPEDWTSTATSQNGRSATPAPPAINGRARRNDDDEDDYPDTWLR